MKRIVVLLFATASAVVLLLCPFFFVQAQQDMFSAFDAPLPSEASSSSATASENSYDSYSSNSFQSVAQAFEANPSLAAEQTPVFTAADTVPADSPADSSPFNISPLSMPEPVTSGNLDFFDDISLTTFSLQTGTTQVQAEKNLDSFLLLLAPPYDTADNLKYALAILEPFVLGGNIRAELTEDKIGEAVLNVAGKQGYDPDIRQTAVVDILNPLAQDENVSGSFKERMGGVLENIVFKEQASGADAQKINDLKLNSLVTLNRIVEDEDVNAEYKESLIDPLLGLKDNVLFNEEAFVIIDTITADPAVSPAAKEKLFPSLLAITKDLQVSAPEKAAITLGAAANIVVDPHVSAAVKETAVEPVIELAINKSIDDKLKGEGFLLLAYAAADNRVSASSKEKIIINLGNINPQDKSLEESFTGLSARVMSAILYDKDVNPVPKERMLDQLFLPVLSSKNSASKDLLYTAQNIGSIIQDSEVSAAGKEKVVQPLEKLITDNLADMKTKASWCDVLAAGLGDLTMIMNDPKVSQSTKDGIKTWISGLDIFTTQTKDIWDKYNTVVISTKGAFLNDQTLTAVYNVLDSQPESFRPGIIRFHVAADSKNQGNYDYTTSLVNINGAGSNRSAYQYEGTLLHEIGHYSVFSGKFDAALLTDFDSLWDDTESYFSCTDPDGYLNQDEDMATVFTDYTSNTEGLVGRAVFLASNPVVPDDILLRKVEGIAKLYSHTVSPGKETYTYFFSIDPATGSITRKEVLLTNHDISAKKYFLPNTEKLSNTKISKKDIPL